jgi:signal transduction histidine kinase
VLARADAGAYQLRPVDLYVDEIVTESRRTVDVLASVRGVSIEARPTSEIRFRGDEDLLQQMIVNVLQNAIQHTPTGGTVRLELSQGPDGIDIRVQDAGAGIPPEASARIFDRFVQLDPSRRGHGTGLGLPIARWIAEAHGGTLTLDHSGPDGSTFTIRLPRQSEGVAVPGRQSPPP